jgi:hypothetical protein
MPAARARSASAAAIWCLRVPAGLLLVSMLAAALHDVSRAWDVWYYHLPFAARLAGVVPADRFVFHAANQARFEGFPLLGELLQGLLWRVTGRAECANLVAFVTVPTFAWWLGRRFHIPPHLAVLALLAIPLVHLHATSCYVDLLANVAVSALVLLAIESHVEVAPVRAGTLALAGLAAAVAVNTKSLVHPVVVVALAAIGWRALPPLARALRGPARARAVLTLGCIAVAIPLVFATPLKNTLVHGNPYYPVRVKVLGHELPGPEAPYSSSPLWLEEAPRPLRFACSLLEVGIRPMTDRRRWTVDQWMPTGSAGNRMGGFFGAYVVAELLLLGWRVIRERAARSARVAGVAFASLTAFTAFMPQSHELRYYLYWMIVLVSLNLWLACRPDATRVVVGPTGLGALSLLALFLVLAVTRGGYAWPSGSTFAELVKEQVDERVLAEVHDGDRVCVEREPYNLLWASALHAPRQYVVKEAERPGECDGYRALN